MQSLHKDLSPEDAYNVVVALALKMTPSRYRLKVKKIIHSIRTEVIPAYADESYMNHRLENNSFDTKSKSIDIVVPEVLIGGPHEYKMRIHEIAHAVQYFLDLEVTTAHKRLYEWKFSKQSYLSFIDEHGAIAFEALYISLVHRHYIERDIRSLDLVMGLSQRFRNFY